jgi:hypothetical protein
MLCLSVRDALKGITARRVPALAARPKLIAIALYRKRYLKRRKKKCGLKTGTNSLQKP